jgi:hypothetical protein
LAKLASATHLIEAMIGDAHALLRHAGQFVLSG